MIKIALIREGKVPADSRVVLPPALCTELMQQHPEIEVIVQPSPHRCYTDQEYEAAGIKVQEDISDCKMYIGVKEVPKEQLVSDKVYCFFSHTIKKQPYNRSLLQTILKKNIRLIDYECLINLETKQRVIAFGRWAGIVGAHNGLWTWGQKYGQFEMPRATEFKDYQALKTFYKENLKLPAVKIAITGGGRVALGCIEIMDHADIRQVSPADFIEKTFDEAVYVQLDCQDLYRRKTDEGFAIPEFYEQPAAYKSIFNPYLAKTDLFMNAIYWNPSAPAYWSLEDMKTEQFNIKVIADITCDIAPEASVPSTIKASTIADPVFGFDRLTAQETKPYSEESVDVMSIDNLPNELPRDASAAFGRMFLDHVVPELLKAEKSEILDRATIAINGDLNQHFEYLRDYITES